MPNYLSPTVVRGTVTRWEADYPWDRTRARITRSIDTDGDETWRVAILRNGTWAPAPRFSGRNAEAADKIRRELDVVLFEREELPIEKDGTPRYALHVGGSRYAPADDVGPGLTGPGFHWQELERDR
jgi:hypothetical protein